MRTLAPIASAALAMSPLPLALLVEMDLAQPLALCTAGVNLTLAGATYIGIGPLGKIDPMQDTAGDVRALSFTLSGVPSSMIALALTEPVQGKAVRVKLAIFDAVTLAVLDVRLRWAGWLDVMTISDAAGDGAGAATVSVTAENGGIDLIRPGSSLYSDAEQQRLYPGDVFLQYLADQIDQRIVWPAAAYFKR